MYWYVLFNFIQLLRIRVRLTEFKTELQKFGQTIFVITLFSSACFRTITALLDEILLESAHCKFQSNPELKLPVAAPFFFFSWIGGNKLEYVLIYEAIHGKLISPPWTISNYTLGTLVRRYHSSRPMTSE